MLWKAPLAVVPDLPFDELLVKNRACQAAVRVQLVRIQQAKAQLEDAKRALELPKEEVREDTDTGVLWKGGAFFKDHKGRVPPDNPDTQEKKRLMKTIPAFIPSKKWSAKERKELRSAVRTNLEDIHRRDILSNQNQDNESAIEMDELTAVASFSTVCVFRCTPEV